MSETDEADGPDGTRRQRIAMLTVWIALALIAGLGYAAAVGRPQFGTTVDAGRGGTIADRVYLAAKPVPGDDVFACTECSGPDVRTRIVSAAESDLTWAIAGYEEQAQLAPLGQERLGFRFADGSLIRLQGRAVSETGHMKVQAVRIVRP